MRVIAVGALMLGVGLVAGALWAQSGLRSTQPAPQTAHECPEVALFSVQELRERIFDARGQASRLVHVTQGVDDEVVQLLPVWHQYAPGLRLRCYTDRGYVEIGVSSSAEEDGASVPVDRRTLAVSRLLDDSVDYTLWYRVRRTP